MEYIRRKCNPTVYLSKFTSNKNILSEIVTLKLQLCLLPNFVPYNIILPPNLYNNINLKVSTPNPI